MKRMHFDFDFDDNELFDEQTEKVIKAKVREIARKENYDIIANETKEELNRLMDEGKELYYSEIRNIIKKRIESIVIDVIDTPEFREKIYSAITKRISDIIDVKIATLDSSISKDVRKAVDEVINKAVSGKLSKIFDALDEKGG